MQSVVVTGVSTGIGRAIAVELIAGGYRVFGSVRRRLEGEELVRELGENFIPLEFDVTDAAAIGQAVERVESMLGGGGLRALINNAGIGFGRPSLEADLDEFRQVFEVNFFGLLQTSRAFLPMLGATPDANFPPGRIININSIFAFYAPPFVSAYCAVKAAVQNFSDSLRRELRIYGVDVLTVNPGHVQTPIFDKAEEAYKATFDSKSPYRETLRKVMHLEKEMGRNAMPPERAARLVRKVLEQKRPRTRNMILSYPFREWILFRILPHRMLDRLYGAMLGMSPPKKVHTKSK